MNNKMFSDHLTPDARVTVAVLVALAVMMLAIAVAAVVLT